MHAVCVLYEIVLQVNRPIIVIICIHACNFLFQNRVAKAEALMNCLLLKDGSALLNFLRILKNDEQGYEDFVKLFYSDIDELQCKKSTSKLL